MRRPPFSRSGSRRAGGGAPPPAGVPEWQKCQVSGTGRKLVRIVSHSPCTWLIHPPRSSGLRTVALMHSSWMCGGRLMIT